MPSDGKAGSEAETARDGAFSYAAEWHAFAHGMYTGMKDWKPSAGGLPDDPDIQAEPHYYKGGFIAGSIFQFLCMIVFVAGVAGVI